MVVHVRDGKKMPHLAYVTVISIDYQPKCQKTTNEDATRLCSTSDVRMVSVLVQQGTASCLTQKMTRPKVLKYHLGANSLFKYLLISSLITCNDVFFIYPLGETTIIFQHRLLDILYTHKSLSKQFRNEY